MNRSIKLQSVEPSCRGGSSPEVSIVRRPEPFAADNTQDKVPGTGRDGFAGEILGKLSGDSNLIYLTARIQNYSELTDARLYSLRQSIDGSDAEAVVETARVLTDSTAKMGAISLMKHCIAMQMLGRRKLFSQAKTLLNQIESEFQRFKQNLISAVG